MDVKKQQPRLAQEDDIWAGSDPERVLRALQQSAGALSGQEGEALTRDIKAARGQKGREFWH
jgi:hypothetical protein